ncbi:hypothetical protein KFE25_003503 [Diacronema lutheri]|uniref:PI-PLC Y-box domain-containing protein n=3 Tax=Diacronema lutheri TaxID=2081491 RepID=A0A8J5XS59_DIALT|nr:hypothetical protein KFE25_003503 [Diacronema lutheri]
MGGAASTCAARHAEEEDDGDDDTAPAGRRRAGAFALRRIFAQYAERGEMTAQALMLFCSREQSSLLELAAARELVSRFSRRTAGASLSFHEFRTMLLDGPALQFKAEWLPVLAEPHALDRPLAHFFVNSSLATAGPLNAQSPASPAEVIAAYARAIVDGVRCVEVHAYDGAPDAPFEPLVRRPAAAGGAALSLRALLRAIVGVLPEWHLPLILSIEHHMSAPISIRGFASVSREELRGRLFVPDVDRFGRPARQRLPLVSELRGRVLLRCRTLGNVELERLVALRTAPFRGNALDGTSALDSADLPAGAVSRLLVPVYYGGPAAPARAGGGSGGVGGTTAGLFGLVLSASKPADNGERVDVTPGSSLRASDGPHAELALPARAGGRTGDGSGGGADERAAAPPPLMRHAVSLESAVDALRYTAARAVRTHSGADLSAAGALDPLRAWELGAQCAAVLTSAPGLAADLNRAMFARNGGQGYVAKPAYMCETPGGANPFLRPRHAASAFFSKAALSIADVLALNQKSARPHRARLTLTVFSAFPVAASARGARGAAPTRGARALGWRHGRELLLRASVLTGYGGFEQQATESRGAGPRGAHHWGERLTLTSPVAELAFLRLELREAQRLRVSFTAWLPAIGPGVRCFELTSPDGTVTYRLLCRCALQLRAESDGAAGPYDDDGREDGFGGTELETRAP